MKKIGMLVAVEINAVLAEYGTPVRIDQIGTFSVRVYEKDGYEMYVLHSGAGEIAAAAGTQILLSVYQAEMIVNFGVVGGLTEDMKVARAGVVTKVVHYDFDTSALDPVVPGQYCEYPSPLMDTTEALWKKALEIDPELVPVIAASGDKFVSDPEAKRKLHDTYGADICEMESAAILLTCDRNGGIPVLMIKMVSDSVAGEAAEFSKELDRTSRLCFSLADRIVKEMI